MVRSGLPVGSATTDATFPDISSSRTLSGDAGAPVRPMPLSARKNAWTGTTLSTDPPGGTASIRPQQRGSTHGKLAAHSGLARSDRTSSGLPTTWRQAPHFTHLT